MFESDAAGGMLHDPSSVKAPAKKVRTMVITHHHPSKDKPYHHLTVTHHHTSSAHPPEHSEVRIKGSGPNAGLDAMHDHLEQHMGEPNPGEEAAEAGEPEGTE